MPALPFALLTPVFGILFGVLILDEQFTWWMLAGSLITLAGVTIITIRRPADVVWSIEDLSRRGVFHGTRSAAAPGSVMR